jgi:hypothetical protein
MKDAMTSAIATRKYCNIIICFLLAINQVMAQTSVKKSIQSSTVYAGIEVGSKGVKLSLIDLGKNGQRNGSFIILKDSAVNTDFISFTPSSFQATLKGLTGLYQSASNQYQVSADRIFTVFSSGVKVQAEKESKQSWLVNLADSFRKAIKEPSRTMLAIDVADEARLSHLGIVPSSRRYNTFLIDIGSGNTKGGYFPNGNTNDFKLFQLTWGTKSINNATEKRVEDDISLNNYARQMFRVLAGQANDEIVYAVNVSGAYNMSDNIAFSGGISWATATLMYPELADNPVVPVQFEDVLKYSEKLQSSFGSFSDSALVNGLDETADKTLVAKEVKTVHKVFDQRALMAGTGLLLKIMRQFEGVYDKKQFFLVKNGQVGWISAFVDQSVSGK